MTLTTHHLLMRATAATPLELDEQAGSQVRGALVNALLDRFCANKNAPSCSACALLAACPVGEALGAVRDDPTQGGEQQRRPYVVRPPTHTGRYAPGDQLTFGMSLFGTAAQLFTFVAMAATQIERSGIGRPLAANHGRRGLITLDAIDAVHPLSGEIQRLYTQNTRTVQRPTLSVAPADVEAYAAHLPANQLAIRFITPLRLITKGADGERHLVRRFDPSTFVRRLAERANDLSATYGDGPLALDSHTLGAYAARLDVTHDTTRWVDVVSHSAHRGTRTPIGGLLGTITLQGDLRPLRAALVWGSLLHVGKNAVKGDGYYTVSA